MPQATAPDVATLAAHHWGQWEAAIRERDDVALGALAHLLDDMTRIWPADRPTERQLDVLQLVANGLSHREVAERLWITVETVKGHLRGARARLGANSTTHAVAIAWRECLID